MQIVFYLGANCTDGDRLLRSLMKDVDSLGREGVAVPGPGRYRKILRETIQSLGPGPATPPPRPPDVQVEAGGARQKPERVVMSNQAFLSLPSRIFDGRQFYPQARTKLAALDAIFAEDDLELCLALRNPATFIPAAWEQAPELGFEDFLHGIDPRQIRWSDLVLRLRNAAPDARLTVWCTEDTLLIWNSLLRRLAGRDGPGLSGAAPGGEGGANRTPTEAPAELMSGAWDMLATAMSPEGLARLLSYVKSHPGQSETQTRLVIGAFLDKYALPEEIEQEIDLPGWDMALVEELTRLYEADLALIAAMEGVEFIAA